MLVAKSSCNMTSQSLATSLHATLLAPHCVAVRYSPVVSEIEVGELLCDSLVNAEDASTLAFVLLEGERVVADQTSYTVKDGEAFTDGIGRKVCLGHVSTRYTVPQTCMVAYKERYIGRRR